MTAADRRAEITPKRILAVIYARRNRRRIIWSPSTTLGVMGIEWYPHAPPDNYRKMKRVLAQLCQQRYLVKRPRPHAHYSMKEVAYERVGEDHSGVGG